MGKCSQGLTDLQAAIRASGGPGRVVGLAQPGADVTSGHQPRHSGTATYFTHMQPVLAPGDPWLMVGIWLMHQLS